MQDTYLDGVLLVLVNIKCSVYVHYMKEKALSKTGLWVLVALSYGPGYGYGLQSTIWGLSYMTFRPSAQRVEHAVKRLMKLGLAAQIWTESGTASPYPRFMYGLTDRGERRLRLERQDLATILGGVERALLRQAQYMQQARQLQRLIG
jgi:DNA-binding PadR family transcriptional regulator